MDPVRYELVPPYSGFQFSTGDGAVVRIDEGGYETEDPVVVGELDRQPHAVRRVEVEAEPDAKRRGMGA